MKSRNIKQYLISVSFLSLTMLVSCGQGQSDLINKKDGFYEVVNYSNPQNIKLRDKPIITVQDIKEVKRIKDGKRSEISIVLNKEGAKKLYLFTKKNMGKPISIVVGNKIVSMPMVRSEIKGGRINITGGFSDTEIDKMIQRLKD